MVLVYIDIEKKVVIVVNQDDSSFWHQLISLPGTRCATVGRLDRQSGVIDRKVVECSFREESGILAVEDVSFNELAVDTCCIVILSNKTENAAYLKLKPLKNKLLNF